MKDERKIKKFSWRSVLVESSLLRYRYNMQYFAKMSQPGFSVWKEFDILRKINSSFTTNFPKILSVSKETVKNTNSSECATF